MIIIIIIIMQFHQVHPQADPRRPRRAPPRRRQGGQMLVNDVYWSNNNTGQISSPRWSNMAREPSTVSCAGHAVEASPKRLQRFGGVSEAFPTLRRRLRSVSNGPNAPGWIPSENASRIRQIKTGQKGRMLGQRAVFFCFLYVVAQVVKYGQRTRRELSNNDSCAGQIILVKSYWSNHVG